MVVRTLSFVRKRDLKWRVSSYTRLVFLALLLNMGQGPPPRSPKGVGIGIGRKERGRRKFRLVTKQYDTLTMSAQPLPFPTKLQLQSKISSDILLSHSHRVLTHFPPHCTVLYPR